MNLYLILFTILLLLFITGGGLYYLTMNYRQTTTVDMRSQEFSPDIVSRSTQGQWLIGSVPLNIVGSSAPIHTSQQIDLINLSRAWSLGAKTYSNSKIDIIFDYPSYFQTRVIDVEKENMEWAEKYKDDQNVEQPLHLSSFYSVVYTPDISSEYNHQILCDNKMTVSIQQYNNPKGLNLYDFVSDLNNKNSLDGQTNPMYKNNLTQSHLPKTGSYIFKGVIGETPVKEVYFIHNRHVYRFSLIGNCDTGGQYSEDAEAVFDNILKGVKYL